MHASLAISLSYSYNFILIFPSIVLVPSVYPVLILLPLTHLLSTLAYFLAFSAHLLNSSLHLLVQIFLFIFLQYFSKYWEVRWFTCSMFNLIISSFHLNSMLMHSTGNTFGGLNESGLQHPSSIIWLN